MNGILRRALVNRHALKMIYMNQKGDLSYRIIKVLSYDANRIQAYCYSKRQFRTFRLANILSIAPYRQERGA